MASKYRDLPRGATPIPKKKKSRQWSVPRLRITAMWIVLPILVSVIVLGGRWAYQSWPVTHIEVNGRLAFWNAEHINRSLDWVKGESFFSLDVNKVHQQVQALPLVMKVSVRKRWPGTLEVQLIEDIPVAIWNDNQLLSASGIVSDIPEGMSIGHLTGIRGPEKQAEQAVRYFRRIQQMLNAHSVSVRHLSMSSTGAITVILSNGWKAKFGRQYFEERVLRLEKLLQHLPQEKVAEIDLRYGKGAAIRWRQEQEIG